MVTTQKKDSVLYVGGLFTQIGSQYRSGLGAIGGRSLQPTPWQVDLTGGYGYPEYLTIEGNTMFLAGPGFAHLAADRSLHVPELEAQAARTIDPAA